MYYELYKRFGPTMIFIGKLQDGSIGKNFVVYNSPDGILVGDEYYIYEEDKNVLRWCEQPGENNERQVIGFADTEEEAFSIANAV